MNKAVPASSQIASLFRSGVASVVYEVVVCRTKIVPSRWISFQQHVAISMRKKGLLGCISCEDTSGTSSAKTTASPLS